jgi:hypothetical protein
MTHDVVPVSTFAAAIGVDRRTVSEMVRLHKVPTKPVPFSSSHLGLDADARGRLCRLLNVALPEPAGAR